jgi:hypothetical protein
LVVLYSVTLIGSSLLVSTATSTTAEARGRGRGGGGRGGGWGRGRGGGFVVVVVDTIAAVVTVMASLHRAAIGARAGPDHLPILRLARPLKRVAKNTRCAGSPSHLVFV